MIEIFTVNYFLKHTFVFQCAQEYKHLPESLYPHTYNPKMSLDISAVQDGHLCNSRVLSSVSDKVGHVDALYSS
jgi:topoisomerase (DNA) II binding protein 1